MSSNVKFNPLVGLFPKQQEILLDIYNSKVKFNLLRASRQAGKTVLLHHASIMFSFQYVGGTGAYISPSHSQSIKAYNNILKKLPRQLIFKTKNSDSDRHIILTNGSEIQFKSAKNYEMIRGNSYDWVILDEFCFMNPVAWETVIKQTIAAKKDAKIIFASTPLGRDLFYKFHQYSADPDKKERYKEYYFTWRDNPRYDKKEVKQAKKELPEAIYNQEYEGMFIFGNSTVFGDFSRLQIIKDYLPFHVPGHKYFFGLDVSGSGSDSTVLTIINQRGEVVFIYEAENERLKEQSKELIPIIQKFNCVGYVEKNGLGVGLLEELEEKLSNVYGWITSNESKQELVKDFNLAVSNNKVWIPTNELCSKLDNQLSTFQVIRTTTGKLKYTHLLNLHDDYVDSLLLANKARIELDNVNNVRFVDMDGTLNFGDDEEKNNNDEDYKNISPVSFVNWDDYSNY